MPKPELKEKHQILHSELFSEVCNNAQTMHFHELSLLPLATRHLSSFAASSMRIAVDFLVLAWQKDNFLMDGIPHIEQRENRR